MTWCLQNAIDVEEMKKESSDIGFGRSAEKGTAEQRNESERGVSGAGERSISPDPKPNKG